MSWVELSIVLFISHLVGDFLVQTEWQASHKHGGLGRDPTARRALGSHILSYTLSFVPALVWIGYQEGLAWAIAAAALVALPHLVIDDGRLLLAYMRRFKGAADPPPVVLTAAVDQSAHLICLWAAALLIAA